VRVAGLDNGGRAGAWSAWASVEVLPLPPSDVEPETPIPDAEPPDPLLTGVEPEPPPDVVGSAPVRARVEPDTIALVADGSSTAEVAVSFYDDASRLVSHLPLRVSCTDGAIEVVTSKEGQFRVRYRAPGSVPVSGTSDIALAVGDFETHARVELSQPIYRWRVAAHVGWLTNAAVISSPYVAVSAGWQAPWLDERLAVTARVGYYRMRDSVEGIPVTGHFSPIVATALYTVLRVPVRVYAGLGGGIVVGISGPEYDVDARLHPIASSTIGVAYPFGPGEIDAAIAGELSIADQRGFSGRLAGLLVSVGYRYTLPW
jgi:hypothetical protein